MCEGGIDEGGKTFIEKSAASLSRSLAHLQLVTAVGAESRAVGGCAAIRAELLSCGGRRSSSRRSSFRLCGLCVVRSKRLVSGFCRSAHDASGAAAQGGESRANLSHVLVLPQVNRHEELVLAQLELISADLQERLDVLHKLERHLGGVDLLDRPRGEFVSQSRKK